MKRKTILVAFIVFICDLITKYLVFNSFKYDISKVVIKNFFSIHPIKNTGAAFSFFENNQIFLILISTIILVYLVYLFIKNNNTKLKSLSYGLLIGGLFGNLFDRVFYSHVRDFLSFRIFGFDFAIFNLADVAVVLGAFLLLALMFKEGKK